MSDKPKSPIEQTADLSALEKSASPQENVTTTNLPLIGDAVNVNMHGNMQNPANMQNANDPQQQSIDHNSVEQPEEEPGGNVIVVVSPGESEGGGNGNVGGGNSGGGKGEGKGGVSAPNAAAPKAQSVPRNKPGRKLFPRPSFLNRMGEYDIKEGELRPSTQIMSPETPIGMGVFD